MFATRRLLASAWRRRFSSNSAVSANDSRLAQQVAARAALPPKFAIVDSTLREGEQFMTAEFTKEDRVYIATMLDRLGVEYIELVNPVASSQAKRDCEVISNLGLRAKVLAHTRCHMDDVRAAVSTGIDGVNLYMATSAALTPHSHGKSLDRVRADARHVVEYVLQSGKEVRFSCEDAFRSNLADILPLYAALAQLGVHRVGVADTVGVATPWQVFQVVSAVRDAVGPDVGIEFHTHNDTGCCVANAYMALLGGATHIDTSVLGIGERNGITPLGGFLARLYTVDRETIRTRYNLPLLRPLEKFVAAVVGQTVPFNNYVTGSSAFTHKAGVHSKAVMKDPSAYEVIDPADFGVERSIQLAHRLTGWNAIQARSRALGLELSDEELRAATQFIKNLADERPMTLDMIDTALIQLATGPRVSSSQFIQLSAVTKSENPELAKIAADAVKALEAFTVAAARTAVEQSAKKRTATPEARVRVVGHLFDKNVLNVLMDLLVDSPTTFSVESIYVPHTNEDKSSAVIRISPSADAKGTAAQIEQINGTLDQLQVVIRGLAKVADCSAELIKGPEDVAPVAAVSTPAAAAAETQQATV